MNKLPATELKEIGKKTNLFAQFTKSTFEPIYQVTIVDSNGHEIKKDFDNVIKRPSPVKDPPVADIQATVAKPTSKYSRVPIYPGAVYDVYALQLQSTDSFIFAQRTKPNSFFAQSIDSDLADYCSPVVIRYEAGLEL